MLLLSNDCPWWCHPTIIRVVVMMMMMRHNHTTDDERRTGRCERVVVPRHSSLRSSLSTQRLSSSELLLLLLSCQSIAGPPPFRWSIPSNLKSEIKVNTGPTQSKVNSNHIRAPWESNTFSFIWKFRALDTLYAVASKNQVLEPIMLLRIGDDLFYLLALTNIYRTVFSFIFVKCRTYNNLSVLVPS